MGPLFSALTLPQLDRPLNELKWKRAKLSNVHTAAKVLNWPLTPALRRSASLPIAKCAAARSKFMPSVSLARC